MADVLVSLGFFGVIAIKIWTSHLRRMAEIQIQQNGRSEPSLRQAIEEMRRDINGLRDTTMQYDLSFDTALQRLEQRVQAVELRAAQPDSGRTIEAVVGR